MKNRTLAIFLLAAIVMFDSYYFMTHRDEFQLLTRFSFSAVAVLLCLEGVMVLCLGWQVKLLTDHYDLNLSFSQWFGVARVTSLANLVFGFAAGTSVKAVYLKRFHNLRYGSFIAATGVATLIKFMIGALLASTFLVLMGQVGTVLFPLAAAVFLSTIAFLGFGHRLPGRYLGRWRVLQDLTEEWQSLRRNHKLVSQLAALSLLIFGVYTLEVYFAFVAFGLGAPIYVTAIISAFDSFAGAFKLMPGNFGVKEAIFGGISGVYGIGVNEGVHAAVLHRVIRTVVSLISGSGFVYQLLRSGSLAPAHVPESISRGPTRVGEKAS